MHWRKWSLIQDLLVSNDFVASLCPGLFLFLEMTVSCVDSFFLHSHHRHHPLSTALQFLSSYTESPDGGRALSEQG